MATIRPVIVALGVSNVSLKAVELTRLVLPISKAVQTIGQRIIPSHEAIVVSDQQEPQASEGRHGREEQTAFKTGHVDVERSLMSF
jgi:hypothetical protein